MTRGTLFQGLFLLFICLSLLNSGCSTLSDLLRSDKPKPVAQAKVDGDGKPLVKFSESPNVLSTQDRQYHRMTKSRMEEESQLQSNAGSMWVGEGQGAYLFAQNKTRREGDILNVKMDGAAQKQVQTKVTVIKQLLKQLEEEEQKAKEKNQKPRPVSPHLILPLLGTATGLFKGELWRLVTTNLVHTNLFHLGKSDDDVDRRLY